MTGDKVLQTNSRFNHIIHKYAVSSESPVLSYFSLSRSLVRSLLFSLSFPSVIQLSLTTSQFPWISHVFRIRFEHTRFIISAFRAAVITRRIDSRFSLLTSYCFLFACHFCLSHIFSHSLLRHLSLSLSFSHIIPRSSTLRDLLRSLYLTMIYLHVTYTSTSQLVGSPSLAYMILPFAASIQKGERVSLVYNV